MTKTIRLIAVAMLACVAGCGWVDDITGNDVNDDGSSFNDIDITIDINTPCGGNCGQATPTPVVGVLGGFQCEHDPVSCSGTSCSAARCTWLGGGSAMLCAREHAVLADECVGPGLSPQVIDPGPAGAGGGAWEFTLEDEAGAVLAGPVELDPELAT